MRSPALKHFKTSDPILARHVEQFGRKFFTPDQTLPPFAKLSRSICYQQLHAKAAETIWGRVVATVGGVSRFTPRRVLNCPDETLRAAGLSASKLIAIQGLAELAAKNRNFSWKFLNELTDDEVIELLTQVKGIGVWTVQMLLIFSLGRADVLPTNDLGVQKGYSILFNTKKLPTPKELLLIGERWRPFRSVASWYLWRAADGK